MWCTVTRMSSSKHEKRSKLPRCVLTKYLHSMTSVTIMPNVCVAHVSGQAMPVFTQRYATPHVGSESDDEVVPTNTSCNRLWGESAPTTTPKTTSTPTTTTTTTPPLPNVMLLRSNRAFAGVWDEPVLERHEDSHSLEPPAFALNRHRLLPDPKLQRRATAT